MEGTT
jgi:hypothetical protein